MPTLWLIGMMGAGKSTVAPLVAATLGRSWVDTDQVVEDQTGLTVGALFEQGEAVFRQAEAAAVRSLVGTRCVVACGGGVILDDDLVATMRGEGVVVWLDAPESVLVARVGGEGGRPLLGDDPAASIRSLDRDRRQRYRDAAHETVDASGSPDETAVRVVEAWQRSS